MTSIWDAHATAANKLSQKYDPERAARLRASLEVIYEAIKDAKEYDEFVARFTSLRARTKVGLVAGLQDILAQEWTQDFMTTIHEFLGGDMHDFDHYMGTKLVDGTYPCKRHARTRVGNCYGHHTEILISKLPRAKSDKVMAIVFGR